MKLVNRGFVNPVSSGFEVTARHNLEGLADVDDQSSWSVRGVVPFLIVPPDLETRDGDRKELGGGSEVGVAVHAETFGCFLRLFLDRSEERMSEVALAGRRCLVVGLDLVPKIVVVELENTGEEGEDTSVDGFGEVLPSALSD